MRLSALSPALLLFSLATLLQAHPIPDIPVRTSFDADGSCTIRVEVDPRCFEADWESETYLLHIQMTKLMSAADTDALKARSNAFIQRGLEFFLEPQGQIKPDFTWAFTTLGGGPLVNIDDPVMVTGTWTTKVPPDALGYSIRATKTVKFAVNFENTLRGHAVERVAVLFPGEKSFVLDLTGKSAAAADAPPALTESTPLPTGTPPRRPSWILASVLLAAALTALWLARRRRG